MIGLFSLLVLVVMGLVLARMSALARRVNKLENEVRVLHKQLWAGVRATELPASAPDLIGSAPDLIGSAPPAPAPGARAPVAAPTAPRAEPAPVWPVPPRAPASAAPPAPRPSAPAPRASAPAELDTMEQLIGGVWLQNLGAVVLLLGVFLMIVWGYTTGRVGPGVLVAAGVALGLAFVWRGDVVARRMPRFGHALVGTGLGVVYLTLYLGFVRLHVFGPVVALALLALASFGSVAAGLRYRVQLIAALGVIGAYLPQFMAAWLDMGGFHMTPWMLLGYIAIVDVLVFAMTARAGWSALDLAALVLGALAWGTSFHRGEWGWGPQSALAALYTLLALAPLPVLVRADRRVRGVDLAVIAMAPLALLGASAPFLVWAEREHVAILLFALAAAFMGAAAWTDSQRAERDLWAPLTGAAALFVTAALERALSPDVTPLAWCAEGLLLLWLGLRPRAGSLRFPGHLVLAVGGVWAFAQVATSRWTPGTWPVFYPAGLRELGGIAALLGAGALLAHRRDRLAPLERLLPELWGGIGNAMLVAWTGLEAGHVASAVVDPAANAHRMPPPVGLPLADRRDALAASLRVAAWSAQAGVLTWQGARSGRWFPRACGYAIAGFAMLWMLFWTVPCEGWYDQPPFVHATALLELLAVAILFELAASLASRRARLASIERHAPEALSALAAAGLALWGHREATHLAREVLGIVPGSAFAAEPGAAARLDMLAATFTSAAWLVEAVALLVTGWLRGSAFLRWCGLSLLGITLLKFIAFDLRTVDVFWRFLTAIAVGAAMLALSYAYQRRSRTAAPKG